MRAIIVMFDSLNRRMLPPYGSEGVHAPNFARLAERTATFENCYAGSMPCMPARRELHTGRYNFLHRSWGPIEPFDDSMPEILKRNGVYTHIVTDHQHYWEDGGATYHNRYSSYEFFRGQEGDLWKGDLSNLDRDRLGDIFYRMVTQDQVNRKAMAEEPDHCQTHTFDAGLEFMRTNAGQDDWMLQIETFDPHEPFFSYEQYQELYPDTGEDFDWPPYGRVTEAEDRVLQGRNRYLALLAMCDRNLGRVLDEMDARNMWDDTMLIVCTDHGYMLGERGWWGKSVMPWLDETIHTPFFVWDPRSKIAGERRKSLVQTIDIAPTLLDFFGLEPTVDMEGRPLAKTVADDTPIREAGLFGNFGGHVSVTDGRYVYMRSCVDLKNAPLLEHTLMPTHMRSRFEPGEFSGVELVEGFKFTKGVPLMRMQGWTIRGPWEFGTLLYDLQTDPGQTNPLDNPELETRMANLLVDLMRANDAPDSQFRRLGLPLEGPILPEHLLVRSQWDLVEAGQRQALRVTDFAPGALIGTMTLEDLMQRPETRSAIIAVLPRLEKANLPRLLRERSLIELASIWPDLPRERLERIEVALQELVPA
ncbi:sulfatase [Pelagibacterium halotolerans]|uniref:Choline-sulfatase n=1 Tax=Pelagibacterium halotolerans (strain DSM 22347 / JCM 15775 / CGMCC 1.7692 / B2) TaxID=1082931 RepID=G4R7D4_PELHB|nr:sulfatase [Pelagibacterium halotolerans]AEQ51270.1 choline-sulfatase [Pelagibacterium halotolerans B2]QJR18873.1 sulfatase [Pelagibacterium halotolerans]SEA66802.1 Arylsulfatase A [Pelagibacterium halotolerans]